MGGISAKEERMKGVILVEWMLKYRKAGHAKWMGSN